MLDLQVRRTSVANVDLTSPKPPAWSGFVALCWTCVGDRGCHLHVLSLAVAQMTPRLRAGGEQSCRGWCRSAPAAGARLCRRDCSSQSCCLPGHRTAAPDWSSDRRLRTAAAAGAGSGCRLWSDSLMHSSARQLALCEKLDATESKLPASCLLKPGFPH